MNLHDYDLVILNSSGGKDSLCAIYEVCRLAKEQKYSTDKICVSHQDLGEIEWPGTKELTETQAKYFGLKIYYSTRRNINGYEESLLEYIERRGKWPGNKQRFCTSDYKRGPGARIVTALTKNLISSKVLYVFGFRKDESPARNKKDLLTLNKKLTTKKRVVHEWLPIHDWNKQKVWHIIKNNNLPYHRAYDLGMPRLSCCFCVFSPFDALVVAGKYNPGLLNKYCDVEEKIGHTFRHGFSIKSVREAILNGYNPDSIKDWRM